MADRENGSEIPWAERKLPEPDWYPDPQNDGFERAILFFPGYNDIAPRRYGRHGMEVRFLLRGPKGVGQFVMFTDWVPGEVGMMAKPDPRVRGLLPMGADVGYHAHIQQYPDQGTMTCDYLGTGECYYDGSSLAADTLIQDFIATGTDAVWRTLKEWHDQLLSQEDMSIIQKGTS